MDKASVGLTRCLARIASTILSLVSKLFSLQSYSDEEPSCIEIASKRTITSEDIDGFTLSDRSYIPGTHMKVPSTSTKTDISTLTIFAELEQISYDPNDRTKETPQDTETASSEIVKLRMANRLLEEHNRTLANVIGELSCLATTKADTLINGQSEIIKRNMFLEKRLEETMVQLRQMSPGHQIGVFSLIVFALLLGLFSMSLINGPMVLNPFIISMLGFVFLVFSLMGLIETKSRNKAGN